MEKTLTYQNLIASIEWMVESKSITLKELGLSNLGYKKIISGQQILGRKTAMRFFKETGGEKVKAPLESEIDEVIKGERDSRLKWKTEREEEEAAYSDFLEATIKGAKPDLTEDPNWGSLDPDIDWEGVAEAVRSEEEEKRLNSQVTIVFQGGGTKGAFQAGALLYIGQNWDKFDVKDVIGGSTGSFSALHVAAYEEECGIRLATHYSTAEEAEFQAWTPKHSAIKEVLSESMFPDKLDELLSSQMLKYPNRFKEKALKLEVFPEYLVRGVAEAPEVRYNVEEEEDENEEDLVPGWSSEDLQGWVDKGAMLGRIGFAVNMVPFGNLVISALGFWGIDYLKDKIEELLKAYQGVEMLESNLLGMLSSKKIQEAIGKAVRKMRERPNEIALHAAVTSLDDTRLQWVDRDGNFQVDRVHQRGNPKLPVQQLEKGVLASMAYPFIFDPVALSLPNGEDKIYSDGGIRENCGISKAYSLAGRKVLTIDCSPSPLRNWPTGIRGNNLRGKAFFKDVLLNISGHEADLAERFPRVPFSRSKSLTRISPGKGLVGLLESDSGCVLASMLTGFLYTQVALYEEKEGMPSQRGLLQGYVGRIEILLREMLLLERGMFYEGGPIADVLVTKANFLIEVSREAVDKIGHQYGRYYFSTERFEELRGVKKDILELLEAYVRLFNQTTNIKTILPSHFGHLTLEDLLVRISSPLGKAILKPGWEILGEEFDYFYKPLTGSQEGAFMLTRRKHEVRYSDLWGRILRPEEQEEVVSAEAPPSLNFLNSYSFPTAPLDEVPVKQLFSKEVRNAIYEAEGVQGNLRSAGFDSLVPLIGPHQQKVMFWGQTGYYAVFDFENGTLAEDPISKGNWTTLNSRNNKVVALENDVVFEVNHFDGNYRVFRVNFADVANKGPLRNPNLMKRGRLGTFDEEYSLLKRPGNINQLVSIDKRTGRFEIHAYSLAPGTDFMEDDSLLFGGRFPGKVGVSDSFEFLNERVLVHKKPDPMNHNNNSFTFYHVDIDEQYESLVHFEPIHEIRSGVLNGVFPLTEDKALFLSGHKYEVKDSRFRFK